MKECDILGRGQTYSDPSYIFSGVKTRGGAGNFLTGDPRSGGLGDGSPLVGSRGKAPRLGDKVPPESEALLKSRY